MPLEQAYRLLDGIAYRRFTADMQAAELMQVAIERALSTALGGAKLAAWPTWESVKQKKSLSRGMAMLKAQALKD